MLLRRGRASLLFVVCCRSAMIAQAPTVRDSAGIRIVENPPVADLPTRFTLAGKADAVIGGVRDNPADELNARISYPFALRLADGRVLADDGDHWSIFAATGKQLLRIGRAGAGPGEFRTTQSGCRFRGDSLVLWDVGNRRISIWGPDGKLAREYIPQGFALGTSCLADGSILVEGALRPGSREDVPVATYSIVSTTGSVRGTTTALPSMYYSGSVMREVRTSGHGDHFFFADELEFGVRVLDRDGRVVEIVRTRDSPVPVTDANLATRSMACAPDPATKVCTPIPTKARTWPAYYAFAVGDDGRLWFRLNGGGGDSVWVGFDSTGRAIGKLVVAPGAVTSRRHIVQFGRDNVLMADYDDDGARRISVFRLVPAAGH